MTGLQGSIVALVTPFKNGKLDVEAFSSLVEWHLEAGTDGILINGTTGESPVVSEQEVQKMLSIAREKRDSSKKNVSIIAGTGTNSTVSSIEKTRMAADCGADFALVVVPYYNKPSQDGLYNHFSMIAESSPIPVILYNVPGRTGANLEAETVLRLSTNRKIIALKEASGNIQQIMDIVYSVNRDFILLSGDDALTYPIMCIGGKGVISVTANIVPSEMARMTHLFLEGKIAESHELHKKLMALHKVMFIESNPVPVKTALAMMGRIREEFRPPLTSLKPASRSRLESVLKACGLIEKADTPVKG